MGSEETKEGILYIDGKEIGPITGILDDVTFSPVEGDENNGWSLGIDLSQTNDFTASFTMRLPHIGRKQFIRNLQKYGYSKKQAKRIAWETHQKHESYASANFFYLTVPKDWISSLKKPGG